MLINRLLWKLEPFEKTGSPQYTVHDLHDKILFSEYGGRFILIAKFGSKALQP